MGLVGAPTGGSTQSPDLGQVGESGSMKGPLRSLRPRARRGRGGAFAAAFFFGSSLLLSTIVAGSFVLAADTDWQAPTTTGVPSNEWTDPSFAFYAADDVYAAAFTDDADQSYGGFGFDVPPGSIIDGISVEVDAVQPYFFGDGAWQVQVRLSPDGGSTWTDWQSTDQLTTTVFTYTLGGPSDPWGRTWDPTELSNANFRLEIRANSIISPPMGGLWVDQIRVRISYQAPTPTPTPTATASATATATATASATATATTETPSPTPSGEPGPISVTPPATDAATLAPTRVSATSLAAVLASLAILTLVLLTAPAQERRRR